MEEASLSRTPNPYPCGLLYRFPEVYAVLMRLIYGRSYAVRYRSVVRHIPAGSSVLDVCCADAKLASFLPKSVSYHGIDISPACVAYAGKRGISVELQDILKHRCPKADVVVLQGSLYQFNRPDTLIAKLYKSAKKRLIISEPVKNICDSPLIGKTLLRFLVPMLVRTNHNPLFRYTFKRLRNVFDRYHPFYLFPKDSREIVIVITKKNLRASDSRN